MSKKQIARVYDKTFGPCNSSTCEGGSRDGSIVSVAAVSSYCENKLIACVGDVVECDVCGSTGVIDSNDSTVVVEGKQMARVGDSYSGVYSGTIVSGATKSFEGGN